ncbi:cytochrome b562 [Rheinheimera fenheensis]|uniref:cytochrome b562 n=1 Tax=Rheinheimera fenheensis TaxID=3152295 RepID=UPI00325E18B7
MRGLLLLVCCWLLPLHAAVDVEKTMKNMGFEFKQAIESTDSATLVTHLNELIRLTQQAQQASFPADKADQFQQGLTEVLAELEKAQHAASEGDLQQAQQHLRQVDTLRKHYHKLRKVSFWQLLFG